MRGWHQYIITATYFDYEIFLIHRIPQMPIWGFQIWNTVLNGSCISCFLINAVFIQWLSASWKVLMLFSTVLFTIQLVSSFFSTFSSGSPFSPSVCFPTINSSVPANHCRAQQSSRVLNALYNSLEGKSFHLLGPFVQPYRLRQYASSFIRAISARQVFFLVFCTL